MKEFRWGNPHAWIDLDVANEKGAVDTWSIEMTSPTFLLRAGWKSSTLKSGDKVTLTCSCEGEIVVPLVIHAPRHHVVRLTRRGDRCGSGVILDRKRDRRQYREPGDALRSDRDAAHVWSSATHGRNDALLVARQTRSDDQVGRRCDAGSSGDHRSRCSRSF